MRSRTRLRLTGKTADGWYPWFAWFPVRIYLPIIEPNDEDDKAWITAWLETVERKKLISFPSSEWAAKQKLAWGNYVYRFQQPRKEAS